MLMERIASLFEVITAIVSGYSQCPTFTKP